MMISEADEELLKTFSFAKKRSQENDPSLTRRLCSCRRRRDRCVSTPHTDSTESAVGTVAIVVLPEARRVTVDGRVEVHASCCWLSVDRVSGRPVRVSEPSVRSVRPEPRKSPQVLLEAEPHGVASGNGG